MTAILFLHVYLNYEGKRPGNQLIRRWGRNSSFMLSGYLLKLAEDLLTAEQGAAGQGRNICAAPCKAGQ